MAYFSGSLRGSHSATSMPILRRKQRFVFVLFEVLQYHNFVLDFVTILQCKLTKFNLRSFTDGRHISYKICDCRINNCGNQRMVIILMPRSPSYYYQECRRNKKRLNFIMDFPEIHWKIPSGNIFYVEASVEDAAGGDARGSGVGGARAGRRSGCRAAPA